MSDFDIETIRRQVRAMDFTRGTSAEVAEWRDAHAEAHANLAIENMPLSPNDVAFFDMTLEEAVSPALVSQILLRLYDHPDADRSLPITPFATTLAESR